MKRATKRELLASIEVIVAMLRLLAKTRTIPKLSWEKIFKNHQIDGDETRSHILAYILEDMDLESEHDQPIVASIVAALGDLRADTASMNKWLRSGEINRKTTKFIKKSLVKSEKS